ncbi:MAG TPA: serine hydrolase [Ktedonobacterales bacterium]|jgi:hypothetical protein
MLNHLPKPKSEMNQWPRHFLSRPLIVVGTIALLLSLLGGVLLWYLNAPQSSQVVTTNGADRWIKDNATTAGAIPFDAPETLQIPVDPAFTAYYQTHAGAKLLGAPVTPGFPIAEGWIQFFTANALLLPATHQSAPANAGQAEKQIDGLIQDGLKDGRTGIIALPLLHTLLAIGSQVIVGGGLTYVDLRAATRPDQMQVAPAPKSAASADPLQNLLSQGEFIQTGTRGGRQIGHVIPTPIWTYMTRRDVSPDGWQTDFGAPLTDAIPFANVQFGNSHRLLIQTFWRGALIMDRDVKDASGQPLIYPLDTGVAYLKTLVPPAPVLGGHTSIWATSDISILSAPNAGTPTVHVGPGFPLHLLGETQWSAGTLWYHVQWQGKNTSGTGWAPAIGTTFTAPGSTAAWASFDLLSSSLAQYLTGQSATTSAVVYDLTRQRYYAQPNSLSNQYLMGNAIKLPIVLAFLAMTEQQGRRPSSDEVTMLTALMQSLDAETGEELYDEIGRALGLKEYLQRIGVAGLVPENDDLLYSEAQPLAMVQLLSMLYQGKVLTSQDRALVFSLLEHTPPDQQVGVGDTRPQGASVVMQDGWVMGTDGLWAMNSSGIVTVNGETYIISVYSAHLPTLADGQAIARQVCTRVAALLS